MAIKINGQLYAGVGAPGKSAYLYAKEAGYTGTEAEFTEALGIVGDVGDMKSDVYDPQGKAQDVFAYVDDAIEAIPTPDVSGQIEAHNASGDAHNDIRQLIDTKIEEIPTPDVSGQIGGHNTSGEAHSDIRQLVSDHAGSTSNPHGVTAAQVGAISKSGDTMTGDLWISKNDAAHLYVNNGAENIVSWIESYNGHGGFVVQHVVNGVSKYKSLYLVPNDPAGVGVGVCEDGANWINYALIHSGNIGSQNVNYATSSAVAANADPPSATLKNIQASTTDIGAGAPLTTGLVYVVYE